MLTTVAQSDAEYTAAVAMDGQHDCIAMKTIAVLGVIFLPGTFTYGYIVRHRYVLIGVQADSGGIFFSHGIANDVALLGHKGAIEHL